MSRIQNEGDKMKIGILTGGGDCPGLNAVIRAVVRRAAHYNYDVVGIKNGWAGLMGIDVEPLSVRSASGILARGGTILGTSRTNPFKDGEGAKKVIENIKRLGLGALIAVGGEDTLGVATALSKMGISIVGVPKTIDNDLSATDYTFGFDTAVNTAAEAIDKLRTTAESHNRVMVVEVMGRHAGWIATYAGMAGGADYIMIPEAPFDINEVCAVIKTRRSTGKLFSIIVVAEGAVPKEGSMVIQEKKVDEFGHVRLGGIGVQVAEEIEKRAGIETRYVILGHIQRGGSPSAFDRVLATRFGVRAVDLIKQGEWGRMVALRGNSIVAVPLEEATAKLKTVDMEIYDVAKVFFD